MLSKLTSLAFISKVYAGSQPNPPNWDTKSVKVIRPGDPDAQAILNAIHDENGGHVPAWNGQFSNSRYAVLFHPGQHDLNVDIGYYTSVHGLGKSPYDTTIGNVMVLNGDYDMTGGALANFWRSAENFHMIPDGGPMIWAVSQASPLRRAVVEGDLNLFHYNPPNPGAGYASGGFMADVKVMGTVTSGSQQQFLTRNSEIEKWETGVWNMVFVGSTGVPESHCSNEDGGPYTTVDATPLIAEKAYLVADGDSYKLMKPKLEKEKVGNTPGFDNADEIDFSDIYVASESDSAATINAKLEEGLHLILQPGNYQLEDSIKVNNADTVVFGMGLVTLIAADGKPCMEVADVDGVRVSGILFQAGPKDSGALLKWGTGSYEGNAENPGVMHDIFARVGGPDTTPVQTNMMLQVNSGNVLMDDLWLWRADHAVTGLVKDSANPVATGLQVNGDNVTGYGLAVEHTLGDMLEWNGENGKTFFYQSELPYDVTQANYGDKGFVSYKVADNVTTHNAWGLGTYTFFRDYAVTVQNGIMTPDAEGINMVNSLSVFLDGNGSLQNTIDNDGKAVNAANRLQYECNFKATKKANQAKELFLQK